MTNYYLKTTGKLHLLPVMSKILEKVIFKQLVEYMKEESLVHPNLHGSRSGLSTATAYIQLYDNWAEEVEKGNMVDVLLCDQSTAFDLCDHYLSKEKLNTVLLVNEIIAIYHQLLQSALPRCH